MFLIAPHRYWMLRASSRDRRARAQKSWRTVLAVLPGSCGHSPGPGSGASHVWLQRQRREGVDVLKLLCTHGAFKGLLPNQSGQVSCGMTGRGLRAGFILKRALGDPAYCFTPSSRIPLPKSCLFPCPPEAAVPSTPLKGPLLP